MVKRALVIAALALFSWTSEASAASILYFTDFAVGTDQMAAALVAVSGTHTTTTATSLTDFATQIASGSYDLGILFQQSSSGSNYDAAWAALATFVAGGGSAIGADWTANNTHSSPLGATFTGNFNNPLVTVNDPALSLGLTNPVDLANPGWGIFSTGLVGTSAALFGNAETAIVIGNGGRTIFNGFLNDTFADGVEGRQLFINEIGFVLDGDAQAVPEPTSMFLLGTGLLGVARARRRKK